MKLQHVVYLVAIFFVVAIFVIACIEENKYLVWIMIILGKLSTLVFD